MNQAEGEKGRFVPTIKPTVELREALEEIEKCRTFFEQGRFRDYLTSVNKYYLEGQGKVVGPEPIITDKAENNDGDLSEMIELSSSETNIRAGISASLRWERTVGPKIIEGLISIGLYYKGANYNVFSLTLYAALGEKEPEESPILNGRYKQKSFLLKPDQRMQQDVDSLLLTFTSELLGSKIL